MKPEKPKMPHVVITRPDGGKSHKKFFVFMAIAAVLVIVAAIVLIATADKRRFDDYVERAEECYEQTDYENSLRYLRRAYELEPDPACIVRMADCYEKLHNYDKALEMLRMTDTRDSAVASRIAALEEKKALLAEKETVNVAGTEYPSDTSGLALDAMGIRDDDLEDVVRLYALTNLSLADNEISDISALKCLGGLSTLNLSGNNVEDISPLAELPGLRVLYLDSNPLSDFTTLYKLENLISLSIKGIEISESQLAELSNALPNCTIHSDPAMADVVDISVGGVTFKSDVEELDLSGLGISDISALGDCKELRKLYLSGNSISELYALMNLPNLEYLDISDNIVTDLRPLMGLSTLRQVNASYNLIDSTVPIGAMTGLLHLDLSGNPITDFSGFKKLRGLKTLSVKDTGLTDEGVECLSYLSTLIELNIEDNPAISGEAVDMMMARIGSCVLVHSKLVYSVDVDGHSVRTDAVELDLSSSGISDISSVARLTNLETLILGKNTISNIYIFEHTESRFTLKYLDLSGNDVEDVTALSFLTKVEYIDLSNNAVNSVVPLMGLSSLQQLKLSGNPLTEEQIESLRNALPHCEIEWQ